MSDSTRELLGFQRKHLRKLAHSLDPIVYVGEAGISEPVLAALDAALRDHELVKVKLRQPQNKKEMAATLAERSGAELCGLVGHMVILFRPHPDEPRIEVPTRQAG